MAAKGKNPTVKKNVIVDNSSNISSSRKGNERAEIDDRTDKMVAAGGGNVKDKKDKK